MDKLFGITDGQALQYAEVAQTLGVNARRISEIKHRACRKLYDRIRTENGPLTWAHIFHLSQQAGHTLAEHAEESKRQEDELATLRQKLDAIAVIVQDNPYLDKSLPSPSVQPDLSQMSIADFDWSVRTYCCLTQKTEAKTLGDLTKYTEAQLLEIRNFGRRSLNEVIARLAQYGLKLAEDQKVESDEDLYDLELDIDEYDIVCADD